MSRLEDQLNEAALNKCIEQRDRAEKYCEQLKIMLASASDRADEQKQRAEAAEARAAQLEVERDEAEQQRHFWFTRFNETANERDELRRQLEQAQRTIEAQARRIAELEKYQHDLRVPIVPRDPRWSNDGT